MEIIQASQLKKGTIINYEGKLFRVMDVHHHTQGRQAGYILTKLRNLADGTQKEVKFSSSDRVEREYADKVELEYLYEDGHFFVFMNTENYEQYHLEEEFIEDMKLYLIPNSVFYGLIVGDKIVGIDPPKYIEMEVKETEPNLKGATVQTSNKPAILETGLKIAVPFFIDVGDIIKIDPSTNKYLERVKKK